MKEKKDPITWDEINNNINERYIIKSIFDDVKKGIIADNVEEGFKMLKKYNNQWEWVIKYKTLHPDFIYECRYYIPWKLVSEYQILNEKFIIKCKKFVHWDKIYTYQFLSKKFRKSIKYKDGEFIYKYM